MLATQNNNKSLPFNNHIVLLIGFGVDEEGIPFYVAKDSNRVESGFPGFFNQTACRAFVYPVGPCNVVDMRERKAKAKHKETSPKRAKQKEASPKKAKEKKNSLEEEG